MSGRGQAWHTSDHAYTAQGLFQGPQSRDGVVADEQREGVGDPEQITSDEGELVRAAIERLQV